MDPAVEAGNVFVAFSQHGTAGTWQVRNQTAPVASTVGMYQDTDLVMNRTTSDGFYKLLLTTSGGDDYFSEPIRIMGDLTPREYGIVRAIIHQEFTQMRVTNGYPVWHCIPKDFGKPPNVEDPDTGKFEGLECAETDPAVNSYGQLFQGGFHTPILTWLRVAQHDEKILDDVDNFSPVETHNTKVRMMAFPRPARGHMIVNPSTDERYLIGDAIEVYRLRGVAAVAYGAVLSHINRRNPAYQFPMPALDTKAYRRIPYWTPQTLP